MSGAKDGRVFFTNTERSLMEEDVIELSSVGVDIGSSTSHLLFSTIVLERLDARYVVADRIVRYQSNILITPYRGDSDSEIDANKLGAFIEQEYKTAKIDPDEIDTGALILTGVAVRRQNARAIGELFADQAGKFVSVSAGDDLETLMAAHGSGALALSIRNQGKIMNIDVGGGTTKIAICDQGEISKMTAVEAGARLVAFDGAGKIIRIEPTARFYLDQLNIEAEIGTLLMDEQRNQLADAIAEKIISAIRGDDLGEFLRLPALGKVSELTHMVFSGGVSEYFYGQEANTFGDLGAELGQALRRQIDEIETSVIEPIQGIRATVVGASQYTVQVSGSTIYLDPTDILPLKNIPVLSPEFDLSGEDIVCADVSSAIQDSLVRFNLQEGDQPVALAFQWEGSASFKRLQDLCQGIIAGLEGVLKKDHPLILVIDGDVGGLLGIHCRHEENLANPVVSIDGIQLKEFDFIDIGEVLRSTGAVPVVIKSLLFPDQVR
ncbi:MAG: ethanolamine utilization protein EutA [Rhodospirillaceae bacterium]|jgi:ethanolamine utilization protein EutA|nr:ethanolamine utilization protein EutA [Rhodospirillaceae bacterium]MBT4590082.1 ethanolamine utilization protein EutA [Rhodospirillaceae bacterium]MBT7268569.1 ethanolamine utilization protein EutA [Rhodospirillaceae bacterium]